MAQVAIPAGEMVPIAGPIWCSGAIARDPVARSLPLKWSRHPWMVELRFPLADRVEEMGEQFLAECVRQGYHAVALGKADRKENRRARARGIRQWRRWLKATFGDFETNNLPCEVPADTPALTEPPF